MAPEDVAHRHVGVDVLREPDANGDLHLGRLLLDLGSRLHQVLVGGGPVGHADVGPHLLVVVARVRHPHVRDRELLPGERVVGGAVGQLDRLAILLLERPRHLLEVDHVLLERAGETDEHVHVVPGLGRHLRGGPRHHVREAHVVHRHLHPVLGPPVLRPRVEPFVVGGDEMGPRQHLQLLVGRSRPADEDGRTRRCRGGADGHQLRALKDELPTTLHGSLRWCGQRSGLLLPARLLMSVPHGSRGARKRGRNAVACYPRPP